MEHINYIATEKVSSSRLQLVEPLEMFIHAVQKIAKTFFEKYVISKLHA